MDTEMLQIENDLREHGERVVTLLGYWKFKQYTNMSFTVEDVKDNDNLVRLVRI